MLTGYWLLPIIPLSPPLEKGELLPRAQNSLHFVGQGFSLAVSRPQGLPYKNDIFRCKQYYAPLNNSSPRTPIQNEYFRSEVPVQSKLEFFLHRRYTRFGFSPLYPQRKKRKCWTRDTRPQPPHTSSTSPSPFWNKRPFDESGIPPM